MPIYRLFRGYSSTQCLIASATTEQQQQQEQWNKLQVHSLLRQALGDVTLFFNTVLVSLRYLIVDSYFTNRQNLIDLRNVMEICQLRTFSPLSITVNCKAILSHHQPTFVAQIIFR